MGEAGGGGSPQLRTAADGHGRPGLEEPPGPTATVCKTQILGTLVTQTFENKKGDAAYSR